MGDVRSINAREDEINRLAGRLQAQDKREEADGESLPGGRVHTGVRRDGSGIEIRPIRCRDFDDPVAVRMRERYHVRQARAGNFPIECCAMS